VQKSRVGGGGVFVVVGGGGKPSGAEMLSLAKYAYGQARKWSVVRLGDKHIFTLVM